MKRVEEVMTRDPACCTPDEPLYTAARMMVEKDCGAIPVIESHDNRRPVGVITVRDIICRTVAQQKNPWN